MQRELVERARKGDHDAFAELAGAAISRLDSADDDPWLSIPIAGGPTSSETWPGIDLPTIQRIAP